MLMSLFVCTCSGWMVFEGVCTNISSHSCDFTHHVPTPFGTYRLRVKTELNGETSDWMVTKEFAVDKISETLFMTNLTHNGISVFNVCPTLAHCQITEML